MRISDWSSDGCSSDLAWVPCGQILAALVGPLALRTSGWQALWIASLLLAGLLAGWALYTLRRSPNGAALKAVAADPAPRWSRVQWIALLLTGGVFMLWSGQYLAYMTWLPLYLVEEQGLAVETARSAEHTSELQSLMRLS